MIASACALLALGWIASSWDGYIRESFSKRPGYARVVSDFAAAIQGIDPYAHRVNKALDRQFMQIITDNNHWPVIELYRPFPYWQPERGGFGTRFMNWLGDRNNPQVKTHFDVKADDTYDILAVSITGDTLKGKLFKLERGLEASVVAAHEFAHYWINANFSTNGFILNRDTATAKILNETIADFFAVAVVAQYHGLETAETVREAIIERRKHGVLEDRDFEHDTSYAMTHYDYEPEPDDTLRDAILYAKNKAITLQSHPETQQRCLLIAGKQKARRQQPS